MDSEAKFWLATWFCVAFAFLGAMATVIKTVRNSNFHYYSAVNACTQQNGMWVPIGQSGTCVRR